MEASSAVDDAPSSARRQGKRQDGTVVEHLPDALGSLSTAETTCLTRSRSRTMTEQTLTDDDALQRVESLCARDPILKDLKLSSNPSFREPSPKASFFRRPSTRLGAPLASLFRSTPTPLSEVPPSHLALLPSRHSALDADKFGGSRTNSRASSVEPPTLRSSSDSINCTPALNATPAWQGPRAGSQGPQETPPCGPNAFEAHKELVHCPAPWAKRLRCDVGPNNPHT